MTNPQTRTVQRRHVVARVWAATCVLAGCAFTAAAPVWADPVGTYTVTWNDATPPGHWTFTPCGPGCSHVTGKTFSGDAQLVDGSWIMPPSHYTLPCRDGSTRSATGNSLIDATTLAGTGYVTYADPCPGDPPKGLTLHFQLTPAS